MKALKKHFLNEKERKGILERSIFFLEKEKSVLFAYFYGSFTGDEGFNDIDAAVFIDEAICGDKGIFDRQIEIGVELGRVLGYPVDCRALNIAPLSFRFSVITAGDMVFSRDEKARVSFEVMTRGMYFDFKPHADFYYRKIALGR